MSLKKIAKIVRRMVENEVEDGIDISGSIEELDGACGYASYGLYKVLPASEIVKGTYDGWDHIWVEFDNKIVDVTATQFGVYSKVYIIKKTGNRAKKYNSTARGADVIKELIFDWEYPKGWEVDFPRRIREELRGLTV